MSNIFSQVFNDARSKIPSPSRGQQQRQLLLSRNDGKENEIRNNNFTRSNPNFAKTPVKQSQPLQMSQRITKIPATPQTARALSKKATASSPTIVENPEADVRVYLRIRPILENEEHADFVVQDNEVIARPPPRSQSSKHIAERKFKFTDIFKEDAKQCDIFDKVAMPLLRRFMHGVDALLFAYGATSAGKTHTVQGSNNDPGLIPRMIRTLLATPAPKGNERGLLISCVEIYNEKIMDLFGDTSKPLRLGRDGFGFTTVKGIIETEVKSCEELNTILKNIENARRQCSTQYNQQSSRSHCIFMIKHVTIPLNPATGKRTNDLSQIKCSRLSIVDLAGSERVSPSETSSQTVTEACNINKSMLVLGRCIREIRKANKGNQSQIPFRESKLTELFRDFFESSNRQTMISIIVNISPSTGQFDDTLFSLQFAAEAIKCNVKNVDEDDDEEMPIKNFNFDSEDEEGNGEFDAKMFAAAEAKIRQEVHEEMADRLRKIQDDYQNQIEQIRTQSAQPYTSKLQQALAQRMQREAKSRELEECKRELARERKKKEELELKIQEMQEEIDTLHRKCEEAEQKKANLEGNIQKMIEATKSLHERHIALQAELEDKADQIQKFWKKRVADLENEIARLKKK